jgi:type VI secretion system FHA domain protein
MPLPEPPSPSAPSPSAPSPSAPSPAPAPPPAAAGGDALLAAFLRGAGLSDQVPADPVASMQALGASFRAMISGLRQALIARAVVKNEFRIEQTMIRSRGNNPLKFAAGDDDAMLALIGSGRRSDMGPEAAIADALADMRHHELATMAAMQDAVRALLRQLDPTQYTAAADQQGGGFLAPSRKARAFDLYDAAHARIVQALSDDFDSVFGKAFAIAYEKALIDIETKEPPS